MPTHTPHKPHRNQAAEAEEEREPGMLPVEPDQGSTVPLVPTDPEHDDILTPEA